jgi:predicted alpha/beta-fold hydrolase
LLHMAEHGKLCRIKAAATVSSPIDYAAHADLIKSHRVVNFAMSP